MKNQELPERLSRTTVYESDYVCLYTDRVRLPSGAVIEKYHQLHYPHESVAVVLFNERDEVLLIRSRRYTVMRLEWEVPAGRIESGETSEEAARRECREETGCTLRDMRFLCSQNPANGMSDCTCHVFAARVETEGASWDMDEVRDKKWVPRETVLQMLKDNETKCGVSMLALLYAFAFYK